MQRRWAREVKPGPQMLLEDIDLVPLYGVQVVIQCQQNLRVDGGSDTGKEGLSALPSPLPSGRVHPTYQEGPKHGNGGQEVPDVVVIKEVEEDAVAVVLPGLCRGFLAGDRASSLLSLLCRDQLHIHLQPTPWHPIVPGRRASCSGSCSLTANKGFAQIP